MMTSPAQFARFSWSKCQVPDLTPDAEALFGDTVWRTDVSVELSLPVIEKQKIELLQVGEISFELPNHSSDAGDAKFSYGSTLSSLDSVCEFEVTAQALTDFTTDYVAQIRGCNTAYMLVTRARILTSANDEEAFDMDENSMVVMAIFVQTLCTASSVSAADKQDTLCMLRMLLDMVIEVTGNLEVSQNDVKMQAAVGHMWETAFACMDAIKNAHREMLSKHDIQLFKQGLTKDVAETEKLMWRDWLRNMRASVVVGGGLSNVSSLMREFSWSSVTWWHRRVCEAMCAFGRCYSS